MIKLINDCHRSQQTRDELKKMMMMMVRQHNYTVKSSHKYTDTHGLKKKVCDFFAYLFCLFVCLLFFEMETILLSLMIKHSLVAQTRQYNYQVTSCETI